jgi:hypothetical protein
MGHSHDPKCLRIGSAGGGMVLCKQWCCRVQEWPCGASMNRKNFLRTLLIPG